MRRKLCLKKLRNIWSAGRAATVEKRLKMKNNSLHREKQTRLCGTNAEVTIRAKLVRHFIISTITVHFNRKDAKLC